MLDDKYWMDIGGMKSLGGGGDFLPFRRLEASIRSASPNRDTRYTCCTGGWAIGQEDLVRVYRLNHRIRQFLQWKHTSASFLTSVHWLRDGRVYNFTLSLLRIPLLRSEFTLNQDFLILSLEIRIVFSSFPFIIT